MYKPKAECFASIEYKLAPWVFVPSTPLLFRKRASLERSGTFVILFTEPVLFWRVAIWCSVEENRWNLTDNKNWNITDNRNCSQTRHLETRSPFLSPVQTSNITYAEPTTFLVQPKELSLAVDSDVEPNLVDVICKIWTDAILQTAVWPKWRNRCGISREVKVGGTEKPEQVEEDDFIIACSQRNISVPRQFVHVVSFCKIHFFFPFFLKECLAIRHRTNCFSTHYTLIVFKYGTPHAEVVFAH